VERCTLQQHHDFPYFEPHNGRRRMSVFAVRPEVGRDGFIDAMTRRWGKDGVRCSRPAKEELNPHFFVSAIEGHLELLLDPSSWALPAGGFHVRARYDTDSDEEVADLVQSVALPGSESTKGDAF
jgi:hypothetical protein